MGDGGTFTSSDWDSFRTTATVDSTTGRAKPVDEIFSTGLKEKFDPKNVKLRESCDSPTSPASTPIIVALDVTGSMQQIPANLIRDGLGKMVKEIVERKPVSDPHLMFMAVGDSSFDKAPLQVTQFEADIRIAEQLKELWLEGRGGNNQDESYHLPWYFAARKTKIDSFTKRGEKGILFTIGDEGVPKTLPGSHIQKVFGDAAQGDIATKDLLEMVRERYDVYHLMVQQGDNYGSYSQQCWKNLLGQNVIPVSDYTKIPEIIVSTLEVLAGRPKAEIAASWKGGTGLVVRDAIANLPPSSGRGLQRRADSGTPAVWRPGGLD